MGWLFTFSYIFLFFQYKLCFVLCRAIASDEDFEDAILTFYTLVLSQETEFFFIDSKFDFLLFSGLECYFAEIFQLFDRSYHGCSHVVDVKLYGFSSCRITGIFHGHRGFDFILQSKFRLVQRYVRNFKARIAKTISKRDILMYQTVFKDYPNLARALCRRAHQYNEVMELVERWEEEGRIFVIRPQGKTVSRLESKPEVLEDFYQHGIEQMKEHFGAMQDFLEK